MLDINYIREHKEDVKNNIQRRGVDPKKADVEALLELDSTRRELIFQLEALNHERSEVAKRRDIERGRTIKKEIALAEENLAKIRAKWQEIMDWIPNMLSSDTPDGKDSSSNVEVKAWRPDSGYLSSEKLGLSEYSGKFMPVFEFPAKDHVELGTINGLIDIEQSAKVSGSRFAYLKADLAKVQFGLFEILKNKLIEEGFTPMVVPLLVKKEVLYGTSHFPGDAAQVYKIENDKVEENGELYLVGSSEPSLFGYFMDKTLELGNLPQKFFAYTSCFRSEVGSWGRDVRGIKRVHQFDKLEMDAITTQDKSEEMHQYLLSINEWFLQLLGIPYHVILMCAGDAGYAATHKKYDIEVWLPSQKGFMEVMSDTNATDFQARRFRTKYVDRNGEKSFVHNVNDTGCAMGRMLIAILDNFQRVDGSIGIPKVLQAYVGKDEIRG